jgi:hypothetical protein
MTDASTPTECTGFAEASLPRRDQGVVNSNGDDRQRSAGHLETRRMSAVIERPLLCRKAADVWWMRRRRPNNGQSSSSYQANRHSGFVVNLSCRKGPRVSRIGQLTYCRKATRNGNSALPSGLELPEPHGGRVMTHDLNIGFRTSAVDPRWRRCCIDKRGQYERGPGVPGRSEARAVGNVRR